MSDLIHFAHGNGFPSPCYQRLFEALKPEYTCCYIDRIGHHKDYPVTDNWDNLIDEIIDSIKSQAKEPVIAVGHSLGGVLSLMAATKAPELFKIVILLDSPLLGTFKTTIIKLAKLFGLIDYITPAHRTKNRVSQWKNEQEVKKYLKTRPLFSSWDDRCLQDYIDYGLNKTEQGYQLRFDRNIEYSIFRTIPHKLSKYKGKLKTPTVLIYGDKSTVITDVERRFLKKAFGIPAYPILGSHLFPFEHPELTAEKVKEILKLYGF